MRVCISQDKSTLCIFQYKFGICDGVHRKCQGYKCKPKTKKAYLLWNVNSRMDTLWYFGPLTRVLGWSSDSHSDVFLSHIILASKNAGVFMLSFFVVVENYELFRCRLQSWCCCCCFYCHKNSSSAPKRGIYHHALVSVHKYQPNYAMLQIHYSLL